MTGNVLMHSQPANEKFKQLLHKHLHKNNNRNVLFLLIIWFLQDR